MWDRTGISVKALIKQVLVMPKIKDEVGVKTPTKAPDDGYGSMRKASQSNKSSLSKVCGQLSFSFQRIMLTSGGSTKVLMKRRGPGFGKKPAAEDEVCNVCIL